MSQLVFRCKNMFVSRTVSEILSVDVTLGFGVVQGHWK